MLQTASVDDRVLIQSTARGLQGTWTRTVRGTSIGGYVSTPSIRGKIIHAACSSVRDVHGVRDVSCVGEFCQVDVHITRT